MNNFNWSIRGEGSINIILIHGWGFNSKIWNQLTKELFLNFKFYLIDLPGFGQNVNFPLINLKDLANLLITIIPKNSIWLGWSMGSLIVNYVSSLFPENIFAIINICSSPFLIKKDNWPGIEIDTFQCFLNQIILNYKKTMYNFFKLQILTTESQLTKNFLKNNIKLFLSKPYPSTLTLKKYFKIIINTDLRNKISKINIPSLSLYGELDSLIPIKAINIINNIHYKNVSYIIKKSGHMPFISHPKIISKKILIFVKGLIYM